VPGMIASCIFVLNKTENKTIIKTEDILEGNKVAVVRNGKVRFKDINVLMSFRGLSAIDGITDEDTVVILGEDVCKDGEQVTVNMEKDYVQ